MTKATVEAKGHISACGASSHFDHFDHGTETMKPMKMTVFQDGGLTAIENLASELGLGMKPVTADGQQETYLLVELFNAVHLVKIYVYEDEAGFFYGGTWYACETQDYAGEGSLVSELLSDIRRLFSHD